MASKQISIQWVFSAEVGSPVAVVPVDFGVATPWIINLASSAYDGQRVEAHWATIDNYDNNARVTLSYGPLTWSVAPFIRKTFRLPGGLTGSINVAGTSGVINVTLWSQLTAPPDDANLLSIQQTVQGGVTYPYAPTITVTTPQSAALQNKRLVFAPTVADISLNLVDMTTLANGWEIRSAYNQGTKKVSITPLGTDVINGLYTNAAPLILSPGDVLDELSFDGVTGYAHGKISFESTQIAFAGGTQSLQNHGLGQKPRVASMYLINLTAEQGWSVGDEIQVGFGWVNSAPGVSNTGINWSATQMLFEYEGGANYTIFNKATGAAFNLTAARWNFIVRAEVRI